MIYAPRQQSVAPEEVVAEILASHPFTPADKRAIVRALWPEEHRSLPLSSGQMERVCDALDLLVKSGMKPGQPAVVIEHYESLGEGWRRRFWAVRIGIRDARGSEH